MNDPESLRRELEAIAKVEVDRIAIARQTLRVARWAMLATMVSMNLLAFMFQRPTTSLWVNALVTLSFFAVGYGLGRIDLWLVRQTKQGTVSAPKDPATRVVDWFR